MSDNINTYGPGKKRCDQTVFDKIYEQHYIMVQTKCGQQVHDHYIMALLTSEGRKAWPQDQQRARARRRSSVP